MGDPAEGVQHEQIPIPCDDHIRSTTDSDLQHLIVVRIATDLNPLLGNNALAPKDDQCEERFDVLTSNSVLQAKPGTAEDFQHLFQQLGGMEDRVVAVTKAAKDGSHRAFGIEYSSDQDVRIDDRPHLLESSSLAAAMSSSISWSVRSPLSRPRRAQASSKWANTFSS